MDEMTLIYIAVPIFILTMIAEAWWIRRQKQKHGLTNIGYEKKDTTASISLGLGYLVLSTLYKVVQLPIYYWVYAHRITDIESTFLSWVAIFIFLDFCFYWYHRSNHSIRILWAGHVNHHSSEHYNLSTALRQSWTSYLTYFVFYLPILWLGFHPLMLVSATLLNLFYQYWIHTEMIGKLGWLEAILNTPSHHRVHHAINPQYLDKNHGGMFIVWDKIFGTFEPEVEKPIYGITQNIKSFNLFTVAFHEYGAIWKDIKSAPSIHDVCGYLFLSPSWRPPSKPTKEGPTLIFD